MKKILKIFVITVVAFVVLLMVLPFAFRGKIETIIKSEGNKLLNAQFDFESLDISLLRNFPQASVSLNDFWLKGMGVFENDTLVSAGELTAAVNLMALIDGNYEVSKIIVDDTRVKAIVLEDGRVNWDVMKPSEEQEQPEEQVEEQTEESSEPVSFKVALKKLSINDFSVVYDDRQGGMYASVKDFNAVCSGDFGSDMTTIKLSAKTPAVTFRMGGIPFLNRAAVKADMDIAADLVNQKFTLNDNELQLNAIRAAIDGWVDMTDKGMDMDLKLNTNEIGFKEILSLIPAIYAKDFEGIKTDGVATLTAYAKGSMEGEMLPAFDVALNVKNAMFRYPSLPAGVDAINIAAVVKNPGGSADATTISVNPFNFTLAGNPFSVTADVSTPISDPDVKASAKGKLDLGKVKDVYPLEDMNLNGVVNADVSLAARLSYIEKQLFDKVQAQGSISLSDMKLQMESIPDVDIKHSTLSFSPSYVELSQTTVNIGENDLTLDSRFENYLGYLLKDTTIKGTLNVSSNKINLNDFMSSEQSESTEQAEQPAEEVQAEQVATATGGIRVPNNIDFRAQVNMKQVLLDKMSFSDIKGLLVIKNGKVDMQNISLNTMGGSVVANGYYDTPVGAQPHLDAGFALNNISFAEAYRDLDMVQKLAPIFSGLTGNFSGSVKVNTLLDDSMSPVLQTLNGSGSLSTKDLSLGEVKVINMVADIVKKPSLKDTRVKDLAVEFTIKDGRINTKPFDVKLGDYTMKLSGSTGLDQTIDYRGTITIPESAGNISKLGTVDMTIGGTFTSPKVGIDLESLAKQAAQQAVEQVKEQVTEKVKEQVKEKVTEKVKEQVANTALSGINEKIGEALGVTANKEATESADSTTTAPATNAEKAQKAANAIGKAINLLKKK